MDQDNEQVDYNKFFVINIISLIIYTLYLEINPKITGIWLRKDANANYRFNLSGLKSFFIYPLKEIRMWLPNMWGSNVFVSVPTISSIIYILNSYINR